MSLPSLVWAIFILISGFSLYKLGRQMQSKKSDYTNLVTLTQDKHGKENDEDDSKINLKSKDLQSYRKELLREKETKRRMIEEYEHEISYLKSVLIETKKNNSQKQVIFI